MFPEHFPEDFPAGSALNLYLHVYEAKLLGNCT